MDHEHVPRIGGRSRSERHPPMLSQLRYAVEMDIAAILHEIDTDIERLQLARSIVMGLTAPTPRKLRPAKRPQPIRQPATAPSPTLTVLPPKTKREYRRRSRPHIDEPRALASAVTSKPVFVPRAALETHPKPMTATPLPSADALEAALRHNLLGGAA
jgi:hypothetical protein